jgi:hypothetical protein
MKIQHIILLLLLAGGITVGAQTTNTPTHTKAMNYKLTNLQNNKVIDNPTETDIRAVVASLHDDDGGILTLDPDGADSSMQIDQVEKGRFHFNCQDGKTTYIQKEGHECSSEVAIKILISFRNGTKDWKTLTEWREVPTN